MVITFFNLSDVEERIARKRYSNHETKFFSESVTKTDILEFDDSDIICVSPKSNVNSKIIDACKNLKYVIARSTGIDHIDYSYCKEKNILIKNAVNYGSISVAEYQFSLLLNLTRKITMTQEQVKRGDLSTSYIQGTDLYGKTIGIIGYGNIGKRVEELSLAFGMKVLIYTKPEVSHDNKFVSLEELLKNSDVISLNVPLTDETYHLIDRDAFLKMKDNVILINTSRGKVVDTLSLIEFLKSGKILAAGLDVIEGEKYLKGDFSDVSVDDELTVKNNFNELLSFDNVIITPHNAFNSREAINRIFNESLENIDECLK